MKDMYFKAGRWKSSSCDSYRKIIKRNAEWIDINHMSDDVITIYTKKIPWITNKDILFVSIDCDKKTGEFRIFCVTE